MYAVLFPPLIYGFMGSHAENSTLLLGSQLNCFVWLRGRTDVQTIRSKTCSFKNGGQPGSGDPKIRACGVDSFDLLRDGALRSVPIVPKTSFPVRSIFRVAVRDDRVVEDQHLGRRSKSVLVKVRRQ